MYQCYRICYDVTENYLETNRTFSSLLKAELEPFMKIFPAWTSFLNNLYNWVHIPTDRLMDEHHEFWCKRKNVRFVDFFFIRLQNIALENIIEVAYIF